MARKYSKKASADVERAMKKRKAGTLKSGRSGRKVTSRKQAIAIALSEARKRGRRRRRRQPRSARLRRRGKRRSRSAKPRRYPALRCLAAVRCAFFAARRAG